MSSDFSKDVDNGLSAPVKYLSSKYFYDEKGSLLFQKIMKLPEYYLTDAELNILQTKSLKIFKKMAAKKLNIIELGAGDGIKTIEFLKQITGAGAIITYYPVDISATVTEQLSTKVKEQIPELIIKPLIGDYFEELKKIPTFLSKTVVLFLGANIGNYNHSAAVELLKMIGNTLNRGDMLLIGIDLKKRPEVIANAYNDSQGITRQFNLNLLSRINTELGGTFDISNFDFYSHYDPISGDLRSYLVSLKRQEVLIKAIGKSYRFKKNELIYSELSKKYSKKQINILASESGFECVAQFRDENKYFADCLFEKLA